ncbi:MAG TPA: BON domain-containing protein [Pirellulales bacterium]|nr:BON domain-containing protein [Pirellulales bacterium]
MNPLFIDEVETRIQDRLSAHGDPALRRLSWHLDSGVLVLSGRLPSFYLKQVAQEAVSHLDEVLQVVNRIEVERPSGGQAHDYMGIGR